MLSLQVALLAASFGTASPPPAQTLLLRYKPPVGKTYAYTLTSKSIQFLPTSPNPVKIDVEIPITLRITSRRGARATIDQTIGAPLLTLSPGNQLERMRPALQKEIQKIARQTVANEQGKLQTATHEKAESLTKLGKGIAQALQPIYFPPKPVKVGDTWTTSLDLKDTKDIDATVGAPTAPRQGLRVFYKLVGIEKRAGKTLARITVSCKGRATGRSPKGVLKLNVDTFTNALIDTETGQLESSTTTAKMATTIHDKPDTRRRTVTTIKPR